MNREDYSHRIMPSIADMLIGPLNGIMPCHLIGSIYDPEFYNLEYTAKTRIPIKDRTIPIGFNRRNVYETSKISRTPRLSKK